jgi:hypothetical protein
VELTVATLGATVSTTMPAGRLVAGRVMAVMGLPATSRTVPAVNDVTARLAAFCPAAMV